MTQKDTWSVATVTRNTPFEFLRFMSWYLELGATKIYVVFHQTDDPNMALVRDHPRIVSMPLDPDLQTKIGIEDDGIAKLQDQMGNYVYTLIEEDWMLRLDCDELLYSRDKAVADILTAIPEERLTAVVRPAENTVLDDAPASHHFRLPMNEDQLSLTYGDEAEMMQKRAGLIGHLFGKSFHRTGIPGLLVGEHNARLPDGKTRTLNQKFDASTGVYVLHFNGADYDIWRNRVEFRAGAASFPPALTARINHVLQMTDGKEEALRALYDRINTFDTVRRAAMEQAGCGMTLTLDFPAIIEKHFPGALANVT